MKRQRNTTQVKEETRNPRSPNKWRGNRQTTWKRIQNNDNKDYQNLEDKMEKMQEPMNQDLEELNKHAETNTITETKNTLERINSRISEAEERIIEVEDNMVEITSEEQNKIKKWKELRIVSEISGTISNAPTF